MTDFRPCKTLDLEEFLDKIFNGNIFIKKKNSNAHPEFGHPPPHPTQIFVLFLLEGDN